MDLDNLLSRLGVKELYPTQRAIIDGGLLSSGNFVLAAPTASGKTLAAEMVINEELGKGGKVLYLVPLRALAYEKYEEFSQVFGEWRVRISIGDYDSSEEPLRKYDLIVMTYEKFDSVQRHRSPWLSKISLLILDEVHYVGDPYRGPTLEMAVSKFMYDNMEARRVALSATITNLEEVATWLDARPIRVDWRPVPLRVGMYFGGVIVYPDGSTEALPGDGVLPLVKRSLESGGQAIVFYNRRLDAVSWAEKLASKLGISGRKLEDLSEDINLSAYGSSRLVERLASVVRRGVAFHHAGLPFELRKVVERAFKKGDIKVITATPTLAAGVNLPARTVVISSYMRFDRKAGRMVPISVMEFWQMVGRAGRPRYDRYGEAFVVVGSDRDAKRVFKRYLSSDPEPITSSLYDISQLRNHVLALISSQGYMDREDLYEIFQRTLLFIQGGRRLLERSLPYVLSSLEREGFLTSEGTGYRATPVGKRVSELYVDPSSAYLMIQSMDELVRRFRAATELELPVLHLLAMLPDMPRISMQRGKRTLLEGVLEELEMLLPPEESPISSFSELLQITKAALALSMWISGQSEGDIEEKLGIEPGDLRGLAETGGWLCYAYSEIVRLLGGDDVSDWLRKLSSRIRHGVVEEMLPLVSLKGVGRVRARILYEAGYRTVKDIALATPEELEKLPGIGKMLSRELIEQARSTDNAGPSD
ncbi:MAG TPA: DEAD/DEAH box helicase [Candidatus Korarchaeota archaeon]|nr:DEAD/DEAH box helicase [Candidatus Korarchaeota archaeon]